MSSKRGQCPHGYGVEIRFIACDTCIALRKFPKRDKRKKGPGCETCGHKELNHFSGGKYGGCVVYLEDASGFCPCDVFVPKRRKKLSFNTPIVPDDVVKRAMRLSLKRAIDSAADDVRLNRPIKLMPLLPLPMPEDDVQRVRTQRRKAAKARRAKKLEPKPEPKPFTGRRAPRVFDEEV